MNRFSLNDFFDRMTRTKIFLVTIAISGLIVFASYKYYKKYEGNRDQLLMSMLVDGVRTQHYDPEPIDTKYSEKVFNLFVKNLDVNKKFFTAADMKVLNQYKDKIGDEVLNNSDEFFESINSIYEARLKQVSNFYKPILAQPFDFTVDESFEVNGKKMDYAADTIAQGKDI
jgi:carboxyl-terminal processing protease